MILKLKSKDLFYDVLIDDEDYKKIKNYKWHCTFNKNIKGFYVCCTVNLEKQSTFLLHRIIMNAKKGEYVDHINHNTLDCRKINMRICSNQKNCFNRQKRKNVSSKYKGVSWNKRNKKWVAYIGFNNKLKYLGQFDKEKDAAIIYNKTAKKLFGDFAYLNNI